MTQTVNVFPSSILFNNCDSLGIEAEDDSTKPKWEGNPGCSMSFDTFCCLVLQKGEYPRLQVVERDNRLYTINNTRLALFQRLEEAGYCSKVKVELVPWKNIPSSLRDILCPPGHVNTSISSISRGKRQKGYRLLESSAPFAAPAQVGTSTDTNEDKCTQDEIKQDIVACSHYFEFNDEENEDGEDDDDDDDDWDDVTTSDEEYYYAEELDLESDEESEM